MGGGGVAGEGMEEANGGGGGDGEDGGSRSDTESDHTDESEEWYGGGDNDVGEYDEPGEGYDDLETGGLKRVKSVAMIKASRWGFALGL